jgi:tetratricopeptide (TPR) repeat protein
METRRILASIIFLYPAAFSALLVAADPLEVYRSLRLKGDYAEAESVLRQALQTSGDTPDKAFLLNDLAELLREQERGTEARSYFEAALNVRDVSWQARFGAIMGLADIDRQEQAWQESTSEWNQAIAIAQAHANPLYESFASRGLGETWLDRGDMSRAEPLLKRSLAQVENKPDIPAYRLSLALDTLATLYRLQGKTSLAEDLWLRELELNRKIFGDRHPQTAVVMGHLAEVWSWKGDTERARDYSRQVTSIMKSHFNGRSPALASALVNEAVVEERAHRLEKAAGLYAEAFSILQSERPCSNVSRAVARLYAGVLVQLHRGREAKQIVAEASGFPAK